jgi:hypothetical protein
VTSDYRRSGGEQLSARDVAVLGAVGSFRLVSGGQLQRLFFAGDDYGSDNPRIARRTLQRLTDLRLLHRLERQLGGVRAGSSSFTYALSPAGGRAIRLNIGRGRQAEPSLTFVRHTLAVAEVVVRLHEDRRAGRLDSLDIQTEPQCWRNLQGYDGSVLKPDLFVAAGVADVEHLAWVEVDLGSEHGPALVRKAQLYERYFRSGREQQRLGAFPRVVWLVPDDKRQQFVERTLRRASGLTGGLHRVRSLGDPVTALSAPETEQQVSERR